MTLRRTPGFSVIACAVGGFLVLLTSGRQWAHTPGVTGAAGATSTSGLTVTGHQVSASIPAVAYALLALAVAIVASSGVMRRVVGAVVTGIGVATVVIGFYFRGQVSTALASQEQGATGRAIHASANGWWVLVVLGGVLAVGAGLMTALASGQWSQMSEKYDAPAAATAKKDPAAVTWDALDRGEDPTE